MSVLPSGRPLRQVVPGLDELLHDPAGYLNEGPVVIGPRQMYGLAALFGVAAAALFGYSAWQQAFDPEAVSLGVGLALGAGVWLGWSLMMRGHELVLQRDGVAVNYRDTSVWCPWSLFNMDGNPFVPDADNPRVGLTLPVDPEAIPYVELRRHDTPVAHGVEVAARQFHFTSANEVVLPARYEVRADELGLLLQRLGGRLGHVRPKGSPPPSAYRTEDLDAAAVPEPDPSGWLTLHLTHLAFPPYCCNCEAPTRETLRCHADARLDWFMQFFVQQLRGTVVEIPLCAACHEAIRRRQSAVSGGTMAGGAVLGAALALFLALAAQVRDPASLAVFAFGAAAVGGIVGFLVGVPLGRRLPVKVGHYSPAHGTVSIRFANERYGAAVLGLMRDRLRPARKPAR